MKAPPNRPLALTGGRINVPLLQAKIDEEMEYPYRWQRGYLRFPTEMYEREDKTLYYRYVSEMTKKWLDWMEKEGWALVATPIFSFPFPSKDNDGNVVIGESAIHIKGMFRFDKPVKTQRLELDPALVHTEES